MSRDFRFEKGSIAGDRYIQREALLWRPKKIYLKPQKLSELLYIIL
jgi:hypothetical protein